jgi:hypothetical protein
MPATIMGARGERGLRGAVADILEAQRLVR